ncbi:hypothetical protein [Terracoccus luteus]|uniref:Uncharacterized protein n=1 Tax=Terracoccus luteus TaxID=53356 RepID=A0A495XVH4_9MICO|nr:hypothetical protein [Terracoccus luteus]MBB2987872.1 hypothetical protein [Terracoccus luteus]MCP2173523.1 hypothetical protein [Terracoccus luteus]RKT78257.1 hypothetical protein DFJ68_1697 [Terracoccus luteus]
MYATLWRRLPGPTALRLLLCLVLLAAVVAVLFTWVFPWVQTLLPTQDVTVPSG